MESCLALSPEEARTYSMILDAACQLPKNDPRYGFVIAMTWWLLHRRRRMEQQRIRRRQFYRRWRRMLALRWQMQRNVLTSVSIAMKTNEMANLDELDALPEKRLWVKKDRVDDFWSQVDREEISDEEFLRSFHMSRETFNFLYGELEEHLKKSNTSMREPIPPKKRLAATIFRMATNAEYLKVSNCFGIGKSTTTSLVRDVCEAIVVNLRDKYLSFTPGGVETLTALEERIEEAENKFAISNCVGVVGSIDVYIVGSSWESNENSPYVSSYTKTHALVYQAVVNDRGQFSHVIAGLPASLTNSTILDKSSLEDALLERFPSDEHGKSPVVVLGYDSSFGKYDWLVTPAELGLHEELNDEKIEAARHLFDEAILKLRSRFKIFHGKNGKINFNADAFENIALAASIIHNICEIKNDEIDPEWAQDVQDQLLIRHTPEDVTSSPSKMDLDESEDA